MALMQITVVPLGTNQTSASEYVAEFQKALSNINLSFTLNDMATIIEGETSDLLKAAATIHEIPYSKGVQRVMTTITIDDRRDKVVKLGDKVSSVTSKLT